VGQRFYAQKASDGNGLQVVRRPGSKHQSDIRAHSLVTSEDIEPLQAESEGKKHRRTTNQFCDVAEVVIIHKMI
jgi:hypothetical protein